MLLKSKVKIENWLNKYNIKNYELVEDDEYGYVVNVNQNVFLFNKQLNSIDLKFNIINGDFWCSGNNLTSLKGCPNIIKGNFNCSNNKLTSLEYCPNIVYGNFYSNNNFLTKDSLIHISNEIKSNNIEIINNPELGDIQYIKDFNQLKHISNIYKEKNNLNHLIQNSSKSHILHKI